MYTLVSNQPLEALGHSTRTFALESPRRSLLSVNPPIRSSSSAVPLVRVPFDYALYFAAFVPSSLCARGPPLDFC